MKKNKLTKEKVKEYWQKAYSIIIPILSILVIVILEYTKKFSLILICDNDKFADMLTALITCMSIIISIFGFLIPSLISAKNDKLVKYFIENADMEVFVGKIKSIIVLGLTGILLTILLYLERSFYTTFVEIVLLLWIGIVISFACNSYRFISIIVSLLLTEKQDNVEKEKKCINDLPEDRIEKLNEKIPKL